MRPASVPDQASAPVSPRKGSGGGGFAAGCLVSVLVGGALCAGALYYVLNSVLSFGDDTQDNRGPLFHMAGVILMLVVGHLATIVVTRRIHPGRRAIILTQAPFVAGYIAVPVWWKTGLWLPWYLAWAVAAISALAWLIVWYARSPTEPRRALVFLMALAVLWVGNGAGIFLVAWRNTNGFGLLGQRSPLTALETLTSTSCLSDNRFHSNGDRVVEADCPSGPDDDHYAGAYDEEAFDDTLCADQPKTAFQKWWEWNRKYQISFSLDFDVTEAVIDGRRVGPPYPAEYVNGDTMPGDTASMTVNVELRTAFHPGEDEPWTIKVTKTRETWSVRAETVAIGGWKICAITVEDPIDATFQPGR
jgi:hypothetical protein